MPSTACTTPSSVLKLTRRSSTCKSGPSLICRPQPRYRLSRIAHSRIEISVGDVDNDVEDDDEHRRQQHGSLDYREIGMQDRLVVEQADPMDAEDGLGDNRATEQSA